MNLCFLILKTNAEVRPSCKVKCGGPWVSSGSYGPYVAITSEVYVAVTGRHENSPRIRGFPLFSRFWIFFLFFFFFSFFFFLPLMGKKSAEMS